MSDAAADVVIVGSGAGGAAAALALTKGGASVVLLEAGPRYQPTEDYRLLRSDWETVGFPDKVPTAGRQSFAPMQALSPEHDDLRSWNAVDGPLAPGATRAVWGYHHVVAFGGSTLRFTGEAHRLHPRAMRMRSDFGVAADWPLDFSELEPFYDEAERVMAVAGPREDGRAPRANPYPLPAHPLSYASRALGRGFERLQMSFVANARAAPSEPFDDRPACNYCGGCQRGCTRLDKSSADLTFLRHAEATGRLRVLTEVQALRIVPGSDGRVRGVEYASTDRRVRLAEGRAVVVACGAVESPRLLLASSPDGLGNESGQVGRNFMETLFFTVSALHPEPIGSHRGLPADGICWDYNAPDAIPGVIGGCRFTNGTHEAELAGPIAYATRVARGVGRAHRRSMEQVFGRALAVSAVGECLPNDRAFVSLDGASPDGFGVPRARIHAHLAEADIARIRFMAKTCREIAAAAGCAAPFEQYGAYDAFSATHVFGTCRMGDDPSDSAVDRFGRSWRWRNLFIADASVFPSSGGGESPALTIAALALRTGRHILDRGRRGEL